MRNALLISVSSFALMLTMPADAANQTCFDLGWVFTCPSDSTGDHDHGTGNLPDAPPQREPPKPDPECPKPEHPKTDGDGNKSHGNKGHGDTDTDI